MKRFFVTLALLSLAFGLAAAISEIVSLEHPSHNSEAARDVDQLQLQIESIGASSLKLSWNAVAGADSYLIFYADQPLSVDSQGWEQLTETSDLSHIFVPNQSHQFFYVQVASTQTPSDFVFIPGATFTMGDTRGGTGSSALPTHSVSLNSFYIGRYEVTQSEYQYIMGTNPAHDDGVGANYPVYYVSWYSAIKYCNLRSMNEGLTPVYKISGSTNPASWGAVPTFYNYAWDGAACNWSANGYRLPTEAEWEYAARGATNNPDYLYSGSDDIDAVAWYSGNNSPTGAKPVGTKAPNGLGIYDMSGNLYEWCWDKYSSTYYSVSPPNNPTGPTSGSFRVRRGGNWNYDEIVCRVASRNGDLPYGSYYSHGLRLCRSGM